MLADNLGYGDLSAYNGGIRGGMRTPNIEHLNSSVHPALASTATAW